ncbi:MAG: pacearchaeosortase [Nanoarchaeales archaeon]|nr:pacearchaeosortase [Nanoarchaeales archaeon]
MKPDFNPKLLLVRYVMLSILINFFLSEIFYNTVANILTYSSYYFLLIFENVQLIGNNITLENGDIFLIVKECVAISAYILISLIFLSIPISTKKIYKAILKSYLIFTVLNFLRIIILMSVFIYLGKETFDKIHVIFYEFVSGIMVAFVVIYYLKKHKIRKIYPFFSDVKYLLLEIMKK